MPSNPDAPPPLGERFGKYLREITPSRLFGTHEAKWKVNPGYEHAAFILRSRVRKILEVTLKPDEGFFGVDIVNSRLTMTEDNVCFFKSGNDGVMYVKRTPIYPDYTHRSGNLNVIYNGKGHLGKIDLDYVPLVGMARSQIHGTIRAAKLKQAVGRHGFVQEPCDGGSPHSLLFRTDQPDEFYGNSGTVSLVLSRQSRPKLRELQGLHLGNFPLKVTDVTVFAEIIRREIMRMAGKEIVSDQPFFPHE